MLSQSLEYHSVMPVAAVSLFRKILCHASIRRRALQIWVTQVGCCLSGTAQRLHSVSFYLSLSSKGRGK